MTGVAYLAHHTHVTPYIGEYPSMLAEIARTVFGDSVIGHILFFLVQATTAAILFAGANTSFNGFPALASFVAADRFLPRPLTKRGYRLVFSNGIITLTALAVLLLLVTGGSVNALVPLYAMGVFTGFGMAGYGMTKHHLYPTRAGLAIQAGDQPVRRDHLDDRCRDLRGDQVHRGRLADRRCLPRAGVRVYPAQ